MTVHASIGGRASVGVTVADDRCPVGEDCLAEYCGCWKRVHGVTSLTMNGVEFKDPQLWIKSAGCGDTSEDATLRPSSLDAPKEEGS